MAYRKVATLQEVWIGEMIPAVLDGTKVLVVRFDDRVCAYQDRCAHLGVPLSQGTLRGDVLICGAHHYEYDARTGQGLNPRCVGLTPLPVRVEGEDILVDAVVPPSGGAR